VYKFAACFTLSLALWAAAPANSGILVSNRNSNSILWYNGNTGAFQGTFSVGGSLSQPHQLAFGPDGNLYVTGDSQVFKINGTAGAFMSTFVPINYGGISTSIGLTFASDGNLLVSSAGNSKVAKYNGVTGSYLGDFVSSGSGGLNSPRGMKYALTETCTLQVPVMVRCSSITVVPGRSCPWQRRVTRVRRMLRFSPMET
jgi:hypothetical protein